MTKTGHEIPTSVIPEARTGVEGARADAMTGVSSESLLGERGELKIQHNGEQYSLRRTRHGKLILTK